MIGKKIKYIILLISLFNIVACYDMDNFSLNEELNHENTPNIPDIPTIPEIPDNPDNPDIPDKPDKPELHIDIFTNIFYKYVPNIPLENTIIHNKKMKYTYTSVTIFDKHIKTLILSAKGQDNIDNPTSEQLKLNHTDFITINEYNEFIKSVKKVYIKNHSEKCINVPAHNIDNTGKYMCYYTAYDITLKNMIYVKIMKKEKYSPYATYFEITHEYKEEIN